MVCQGENNHRQLVDSNHNIDGDMDQVEGVDDDIGGSERGVPFTAWKAAFYRIFEPCFLDVMGLGKLEQGQKFIISLQTAGK